MKIIFDLRRVGLGNNGGSSTLIKSGNVLLEMGHDVYFIDSGKSKHTWNSLKAKHIIVKNNSNIPDADIIIATGYKSVATTVKAPERCGIKAHWIRAWEFWQMTENEIVNKVLKVPTLKLVNSICLQNKLKSYEIDSYIIRPGYDFDQLYPTNKRSKNTGIIIGGLYREGVHGQRKRTNWLFKTAAYMKTKHKDIQFWLFGSERNPNNDLIDNYIRSPNIIQKNEFYNSINIWLAPTMSEGLHLPPAEAMITGCPVVSTEAEMSGTQDYVVHGVTGYVADNKLDSFIKYVEVLYPDSYSRNQMGINAREKIIELGNRKENMQKFVDLVIGIIK